MNIAIVHDELMRRGGAEQVVLCFHKAFPQAPIYTMAYQPNHTYPEFKNCDIHTSLFQKVVSNEKSMKKLFFPFGVIAMKLLDLTKFDVILISSTYAAKYVKISPNALVINYCYTPFRLAWNPESYAEYNNTSGLKRIIFNSIINILRKIDFKAAQRTDYFIAMTNETKDRIQKAYLPTNKIELIKPPVDCNKFYISSEIKDYYLVVSRLEYYKKVDLVIEAFNKLGYPLIIVGKGSKESELKKMAKPNIVFKNGLSNEDIAKLYAKCKAFIFPQHEDYGITPLEANASGRPVIAYGQGGVLDTMIPYTNDSNIATALFFEKQEVDYLIEAVLLSENIKFNSNFIRHHAEKFHEDIFVDEIKTFVLKKINESK